MSRSLNATLGYHDDARLVILSCDDLGAFHASNVGVLTAMHEGAATCARSEEHTSELQSH